MSDKIYTIELLYQGRYESWNFEDPVVRNNLFSKMRERFADHHIPEDDEGTDDLAIAQLSASSLLIKEDGEIAQKVPYEWFSGKIFHEMLSYMNDLYEEYK